MTLLSAESDYVLAIRVKLRAASDTAESSKWLYPPCTKGRNRARDKTRSQYVSLCEVNYPLEVTCACDGVPLGCIAIVGCRALVVYAAYTYLSSVQIAMPALRGARARRYGLYRAPAHAGLRLRRARDGERATRTGARVEMVKPTTPLSPGRRGGATARRAP